MRRVLMGVVAASAAAMADIAPAIAQQKPPVVPARRSFTCTPVSVWDGDGPVLCAEGPKVRISGIAAREADGTCRPNHPCPGSTAEAATSALVKLLGGSRGRTSDGHTIVAGPVLSCLSDGSAGGTRTAAWCRSARTGDLSCAMVKTGTVLPWARYWRNHRC
jgi:endonuclease YncB( thermonuclease family)